MSVEERNSPGPMWAVVFVLLSLLIHIGAFLAVILIARHMPAPKVEVVHQAEPQITLSLLPVPQPPKPPPNKKIFLTTNPDAATKTVQNTPVESDVTTRLQTENQQARRPDSPLPDTTGKKNRGDWEDKKPSPSTETPQLAMSPPQKSQQTQAQPQKQQKQPPQPTPHPPENVPPKPPAELAVKNAYNPNGLPVLPPIPAPTIEPQTPITLAQQMQQSQAAARPPPSFELNKSDIAGSQGVLGSNSPAANATDLGRYKAKFYRAVGSRWYAKVGQSLQILPVGTVRIQYTIHSDGVVDNIKVLEGNDSTLQLLLSISQNSITEASPFDPFPEGMRKEVGDSYTDDFTFSIYGG